jgi:hypothetical protein
VVRKRFGVKQWHCRLLWAGFLAFALLALAVPSGAVDEYDRAAEESCGYFDQYGRAPDDPCTWDRYDSKRAAHPLRIVAYALHPVGVVLDWLIFRPAWWIGSHDPFYTFFGRTD